MLTKSLDQRTFHFLSTPIQKLNKVIFVHGFKILQRYKVGSFLVLVMCVLTNQRMFMTKLLWNFLLYSNINWSWVIDNDPWCIVFCDYWTLKADNVYCHTKRHDWDHLIVFTHVLRVVFERTKMTIIRYML